MADGGPVVGDSLYRLDEAYMGGHGRVKACLVLGVSLLNAWMVLIHGKLWHFTHK